MRDADEAGLGAAWRLAVSARSQLYDLIDGTGLRYGKTRMDLSNWENRLLLKTCFEVLWKDLPSDNRGAALQRMFERVMAERSTMLVIAFSIVCALENTEAVCRSADGSPADKELRGLADDLAFDTCTAFEQATGEGLSGGLNRACTLAELESTRSRYLGVCKSRVAKLKAGKPLLSATED